MAVYADDPVYQQWLATLGFLGDRAETGADRSRDRTTQSSDFQREGLGISRDNMLRGIAQNMENRGLTRSGEALRRRAEGLRDSGRQFAALEMDTANRYADIDYGLENELAELQLRDSGQRFSAAQRAGSRAGQG